MKVRAQAKYIRQSPQKVRAVLDLIRGMPVEEAGHVLDHLSRRAAEPISKVLHSAVANAEHNQSLDADDLFIVEAYADQGPTLKRYRPRARGRATRIEKKTSHITIVVADRNREVI
jgi:large subunit ribosomal protein L22